VQGVALGIANRVEFSYARQEFFHPSLTRALNLPLESIRQDIYGVKVRLAGDIIYSAYPQVSFLLQYKKNQDFTLPDAVGAEYDAGVDLNVSASKLYLAGLFNRNLLLNLNLRYTKANQLGLVGFGGDKNTDAKLFVEASGGIFLSQHWLLGAEYRQKPDNLLAVAEDDWQTMFVAWFASKQVAVVGGYVNLGEVATLPKQTGWYLSLQGSF
jgi:hypothetical protein